MAEAEANDDPVALENLTALAEALSTISVTEREGGPIKDLKEDKLTFAERIHNHYAEKINKQQTVDTTNTKKWLDDKDFYTNEINRIFNRYIFKICVYSWQYGALKGVVVDNKNMLDFKPEEIPDIARDEADRQLAIFGIGDDEAGGGEDSDFSEDSSVPSTNDGIGFLAEGVSSRWQ
jgi:hypothetical protein